MLKKLALVFIAATLGASGVACQGGPPDEFCEGAAEFFALAGGELEITADTPEALYAELEATVGEITAILDTMEDTADDDDVKRDIGVVRTAFEGFAENADLSALGADEVREAVDGIEAYAADCEGVEIQEIQADEDDGAADGAAELESVVKTAATAEESYLTSNGTYTDSVEELEAEGLDVPEGVTVTIEASGGEAYCITAEDEAGTTVHYDSEHAEPAEGPC